MAGRIVLLTLLAAVGAFSAVIVEDFGPSVNPQPNAPAIIPKAKSLLPKALYSKQYTWVNGTAGVIPKNCNFVAGGGSNRMLYVGRVVSGRQAVPAAVHHSGPMGTETVRFTSDGEIKVQKEVEWLCGEGRVAWLRVVDLSTETIKASNGIPVGYNPASCSTLYSCLVHSFYEDKYPASVGTVVDGACEFEVNGAIVSSNDFPWWHTLELLVSV